MLSMLDSYMCMGYAFPYVLELVLDSHMSLLKLYASVCMCQIV